MVKSPIFTCNQINTFFFGRNIDYGTCIVILLQSIFWPNEITKSCMNSGHISKTRAIIYNCKIDRSIFLYMTDTSFASFSYNQKWDDLRDKKGFPIR